jgi:hypothetical protein
MPRSPATEHPFTIELWDDRHLCIVEIAATAQNFGLARAAFDEAVKRYPDRLVTVSAGTRLVLRSR